jgi:hypothetical protein
MRINKARLITGLSLISATTALVVENATVSGNVNTPHSSDEMTFSEYCKYLSVFAGVVFGSLAAISGYRKCSPSAVQEELDGLERAASRV